MRIAIVSFGHADSAISMAKYMSKMADVALFFTFALNRKTNNIIDFQDVTVETGLLSAEQTIDCIAKEVYKYIDSMVEIKLFIYYNLKLRSLHNGFLSLKYAYYLRKFDVIHFNGDSGVLPLLWLLLFFKKKVFTIHDLSPHFGEKGKKITGIFNILFRRFQIYSKSIVIIQNRGDYQKLLKKYPKKIKKIRFVPFGKLEVYRHFCNSEQKHRINQFDIFFFGRISPYKGLEYLLQAFRLLKERLPLCSLAIVGGGDLYFDHALITEVKNIMFINRFIESSELVNYIVNSKIVVCPYIEATQSGVAMTAFAFNKPVIATNVGGFKDVIMDGVNGRLVEPKNPDALADAMQELLVDPAKLELYAQNIKNNVHTSFLSWDEIAKELYTIYAQ